LQKLQQAYSEREASVPSVPEIHVNACVLEEEADSALGPLKQAMRFAGEQLPKLFHTR
jgi:hypothetical protein